MIYDIDGEAGALVEGLVQDHLLDISSVYTHCFRDECEADPENVYCSVIFSFPIKGPQYTDRIVSDWVRILETLPPRTVVLCPCQPIRIPEDVWPSSKPWLFSNNAHFVHPTMESKYSHSYYQYLPMGFWPNAMFHTYPYVPFKDRPIQASFVGTTYTWPILRNRMVQAHIDHLQAFYASVARGWSRGTSQLARFVADFELRPGYYYYGSTRKLPDEVYVTKMQNSKFTLCPRGDNVSSLRLYEAIAAGSIPIIISDDCILPHVPKVDIPSECVVVNESEVDNWVSICEPRCTKDASFYTSLSVRLREASSPGGYLHPNSLPVLVGNEIKIARDDTLRYYGNYFE